MSAVQDIGINDLRKLTQVIKEKYDYDFSNYAASSFKRRILRILEVRKMSDVELLISKISNLEIKREEFLHEVTVNVTEMFRDPSFWKLLRQVLPASISAGSKFRIWHAGCSSGEEVYSMLIMLKELALLDKVEITATDIDNSILSKAKAGKINIKNMELNGNNYSKAGGKTDLFNYFTKEIDHAVFDKNLLSKVTFKELDLVKVNSFLKADLILCRNVLIYFNQSLQNDVLKKMHQNLSMGGLLVVGSKETISWCEISPRFSPFNIEEKVYKKIKE
jgi:chemotaxis protein methyltransferase CheR